MCEAEARRLNEGFACWSQDKRPLVLMKVAMTLDGRIAPPAGRAEYAESPIGLRASRRGRRCSPLRWQADAALTGVDTVLADDPMLTDRSGLRRRRPAAGGAGLGAAHAAGVEDGEDGAERCGGIYGFEG